MINGFVDADKEITNFGIQLIGIDEHLQVIHVYLPIEQVIVYLHGEHRLPCQVVVHQTVVVAKINTLFPPCR